MFAITLLYFTITFSWMGKITTAASNLTESGSRGENAFVLLHALSTAIFFFIVGLITLARREPIWRQRRLIGWVLPISVVISTSLVGVGETRDLPYAVTVASALIVFVGTVFTLYALRHLGRNFGVVSDVRGLVTSGPYRWVRHPLYAGEAITLIGLAIAVASPLTITAFVIGMALQIWRAKIEEQALTTAFPEYRDYASRTPMLIPFTRFPMPAFASAQRAK